MKYSPQLNIRSAYNFQQSLIKIEDYISFAVANNFSYAFYAEHNSMYGVAEFIRLANNNNIKPIIGLTIELNNEPLILIAKNRDGYKKLNYLSTDLVNEKSDLKISDYLSTDLIAITNNEELKNEVTSVINTDDLYYDQIALNKISYIEQEKYQSFIVLNAIAQNVLIDELSIVKSEHYLSDEELSKTIDINNNNQKIREISEKVSFDLFEKTGMHLIEFQTPNNIPAPKFLEQLTRESLEAFFKFVKKQNSINIEYAQRLEYELKVINQMGFDNYFLVVWDYVKFAKDNNIMVGPGRGSAAGSLVSFLLGITTIDPLEYGLLFERFLNPERVTMPDIDLDFQDDRREEVIEYLFEKYGPNHVATIITYQSIGIKSAIRDVARASGIDLKTVGDITKHFPTFFATTELSELNAIISKSKALIAYQEELPELFENAKALLGLPRQTGTHAAGIVLTSMDLRELVPTKLGYNGISQTQFDMNFLEDLGLIKMDILGLRNLTTLQEIKAGVKRSRNIDIDFNAIPLDDKATYDMLKVGNTSGIFQLESPGMTRVVVNMKTNSINDISAASALFRPGPQEMIPDYIKRKNSNQRVEDFLIDQSLADILGPTYGIIVYQEQVIQMLVRVANFSLGKADIVRRGMGKKDFAKIASAKTEFINGALTNGYTEQKANMIWDWIEKFASYGFNKSHSIAYSYISYWLAYLKTNYPAEFYCSLLNGVIGNSTKTAQYISEVKEYGIKIIAPSVKNVNFGYIGVGTSIVMPLILIKGIGSEFVRKLREQHQEDKSFLDSIFKFAAAMQSKGLNNSTFEALVWSGAFDTFGIERGTLSNNADIIFDYAKFNNNIEHIDETMYPILEPNKVDDEIISDNEFDYLGFYLKAHPIEIIKNENANLKPTSLMKAINHTGRFTVIGYVSAINAKADKNGATMSFVELIDETDTVSVTFFAREWEPIQYEFSVGSVIAIEVGIEEYKGKRSAKFNRLIKIIRK